MWKWACLVPHPPIILPEVGRGRQTEAHKTLEGFRKLAERLKGQRPDTLLVLSPHAPLNRGFSLWAASRYRGDLGSFGISQVSLDMEGAEEAAERLQGWLSPKVPLSFVRHEQMSLDHGALVPLQMILPSFEHIPRIILANPVGLTMKEALETGRVLRQFDSPGSWALLASGDLSHRLDSEGPYGFHPDGVVFDRSVREALIDSAPERLLGLSDSVIGNAGQCGLQSLLILLGLVGRDPVKVHSYESPFGVGYATASWRNVSPPVALARENLEHILSEGKELDPAQTRERFSHWSLWSSPAACFVTLKTSGGALRGCIGTLSPETASLGEEILRNSLLSVQNDPRFSPVTSDEWPDLVVSVDVLGPLEKIDSPDCLDPRCWGVVVSHGTRKGVLLPDLPGVDSVDRQLTIARQKAGIPESVPFEIHRFSVVRYSEDGE